MLWVPAKSGYLPFSFCPPTPLLKKKKPWGAGVPGAWQGVTLLNHASRNAGAIRSPH